MAAVFERDGLRFLYPENWQVETADAEEGWSVSLQSPQTAFMLISVDPRRPPVKEVLGTTLAALREDYPDLEALDTIEKIANHRASGLDVQFFSLDLVNSCWLRSFRTNQATVLILSQTNDLEAEVMEPVFRAIRTSLQCRSGEPSRIPDVPLGSRHLPEPASDR